jgi:hypothetical protein
VLTVGRVVLQWKYRVPPFLGFLFDEEDFYSDIPEEEPHDAGLTITASRCPSSLPRTACSAMRSMIG